MWLKSFMQFWLATFFFFCYRYQLDNLYDDILMQLYH